MYLGKAAPLGTQCAAPGFVSDPTLAGPFFCAENDWAFAQSRHVSFDEVFSFIVGTPHPLEKIGWGHRCANVIHKLGKEPVLDRCQVDSDPIRRHFAYHQIDIEEPVLEPVVNRGGNV